METTLVYYRKGTGRDLECGFQIVDMNNLKPDMTVTVFKYNATIDDLLMIRRAIMFHESDMIK